MTSVLTVTATDPDGSDSLVYDIISAASTAGSSYFLIDPNSGEISTAGTLDREAVAVVNLQVIATDRASNNVRPSHRMANMYTCVCVIRHLVSVHMENELPLTSYVLHQNLLIMGILSMLE